MKHRIYYEVPVTIRLSLDVSTGSHAEIEEMAAQELAFIASDLANWKVRSGPTRWGPKPELPETVEGFSVNDIAVGSPERDPRIVDEAQLLQSRLRILELQKADREKAAAQSAA